MLERWFAQQTREFAHLSALFHTQKGSSSTARKALPAVVVSLISLIVSRSEAVMHFESFVRPQARSNSRRPGKQSLCKLIDELLSFKGRSANRGLRLTSFAKGWE